jgi:hypothetical protein
MSIVYAPLLFLGVFCYLYFFWNRLKEDYVSLQIFSSAFYILGGILGGYLLSKFLVASRLMVFGVYETGVHFWLSVIGSAAGFAISIFRFKLKFFETFEAYGMGLIYVLLSVFVVNTFSALSIVSLIASTSVALLIVLFYFLETKYKNISWYKSGKVGFSGLVVLGIFFLVRGAVALKFDFVLTFLGRIESVISLILTFFIFLAIYNLSQQKN